MGSLTQPPNEVDVNFTDFYFENIYLFIDIKKNVYKRARRV